MAIHAAAAYLTCSVCLRIHTYTFEGSICTWRTARGHNLFDWPFLENPCIWPWPVL